jgi:hypothetical protein
MELIETKTVGAGGVSSVTFDPIPNTYTDLKIVASLRQGNSGTETRLTFNGSSSSYSNKRLFGTGSGGASSDSAATTYVSNTMADDGTFTVSTFGNGEWYIPNYRSSNFKSVSVDGVAENNDTLALSMLTAGLWSNTAAITSITITAQIPNFVEGSTFSLYGISSVTSTPKATGGIVSQDATHWYHMFPFTSTFTPSAALTNVDYLVVAGGAGGGSQGSRDEGAGGGGAGGLRCTVSATGGGGTLESKISLNSGTAYTVTVGAGGAGAPVSGLGIAGSNGGNSSIAGTGLTTITSDGGGGGAGADTGVANNGGSGGGAGAFGKTTQGTGTANQGYAGGNTSSSGHGGGGGGAGAVGVNGASGGTGGVGVLIPAIASATMTGDNSYYAGGGGGGGRNYDPEKFNAGKGGLGGGGQGGIGNIVQSGFNAMLNTGGGGGGGGANSNTAGGNGGSGIVVIRYAK